MADSEHSPLPPPNMPVVRWRQQAGLVFALVLVGVIAGTFVQSWPSDALREQSGLAERASVALSAFIQSAMEKYPRTPESAQDYFQRGIDREAAGDYSGAVFNFTRAISYPGRVPAGMLEGIYLYRGSAYYCQHRYNLAIADFTKQSSIPSEGDYTITVLGLRSLAYARSGHETQAIADANAGLQLLPKLWAKMNLMIHQFGPIPPDVEARYFKKMRAQIQTLNAYFYATRAYAEGRSGDNRAALLDYNRAISYGPPPSSFYRGRSGVRFALGDWSGAYDDWLASWKNRSSARANLLTRYLNQ